MQMPDFLKLDVPKSEAFVPIKRREAEFVYLFLKKIKAKSTLEIGFGYGFSTVYIISATNSDHYVVDPNQFSWYKNRGKKNVEKFSLSRYLKFIGKPDYLALPLILKKNKKFDFIFIDGDHKFDSIFLDFYYGNLLLKKGGYIMFHDSWMRSTQLIVSWILRNKDNYKRVYSTEKNLVIIQKTGDDYERPWFFFREFYNLKSLLSYTFFRVFKKSPY